MTSSDRRTQIDFSAEEVGARVLADRYPSARATLLREWQKRPDIAHERFVVRDIPADASEA